MSKPGEIFKEKGNAAFKGKDYIGAVSQYSSAIDVDPSNAIFYLNRSMANLKLERWSQAETDATKTLELDPRNTKALYRRTVARRNQGDLLHAREDLNAFRKMGGSQIVAKDELVNITAAESSRTAESVNVVPDRPSVVSASSSEPTSTPLTEQMLTGYKIATSEGKGLGAFALQQFHRGDLIVSEAPLFTIIERDGGGFRDKSAVVSAVNKLSPEKRKKYLSLKDAHAGSGRFENPSNGIYFTNSIATGDNESGIFEQVSRFNHSCTPNARYSWHSSAGRERVFALREIAVGEEIFVSYLSSRNVYGSTRQARQTRLARYQFTCSCVACALQGEEAAISDKRRTEIAKLWESVPHFAPHQTKNRLLAIARALRLMEEEGYAADADDFTNDAAAICAYHSDWESAKYWATKTYEARVAEFGGDSGRAAEVRGMFLDPKTSSMAGMGPRRTFNVR